MKKHTLLLEILLYFAIFFLFIALSFVTGISTILNATENPTAALSVFSEWKFPWYQMLLSCVCIFILVAFYEKSEKRSLILFPVIISFGLLFSVSLLCKALALAVSADSTMSVVKPVGLVQWCFCLLTFLFASFNEEVIYRFYLSDKMYQLITWKKGGDKLALRIICEALTLLFFAFAHLYLGWISVLNAALAHLVLRVCYKKFGKLWPCVAAHFLYNVISLILL